MKIKDLINHLIYVILRKNVFVYTCVQNILLSNNSFRFQSLSLYPCLKQVTQYIFYFLHFCFHISSLVSLFDVVIGGICSFQFIWNSIISKKLGIILFQRKYTCSNDFCRLFKELSLVLFKYYLMLFAYSVTKFIQFPKLMSFERD